MKNQSVEGPKASTASTASENARLGLAIEEDGGDLVGAITEFQLVLQADPSHAEAPYHPGVHLHRRESWRERRISFAMR